VKRRLIAAGVVVVIAAGVWIYRSRAMTQPVAEGPRTARVTRGNITVSVSATGTLQPFSQVEVRSRATGTVTDVRVQEGDPVSKGQLLAVIDDRDARAGYETSQAALAAARARLEQARNQLASTRGQGATRVSEAEAAVATAQARLSQVIAGARPEQLEQSREAVRQAELSLDLARQNLDRTRNLYTDGLVARAQLDQAQNQFDVAQAQVRSAQARLREVKRVLELEAASYQTPQRVEMVARTLLAMTPPPPEKVIPLRPDRARAAPSARPVAEPQARSGP
jgi:HlyD family secretion protein